MSLLKVYACKEDLISFSFINRFEPISLLFPRSGTIVLPFSTDSNFTQPPLCAVYSPLPLQSFQIIFRTGNFILGGLQNTYTSSSPIEDLYRLSMVPNAGNDQLVVSLDLYCSASTLWDTVTTDRYRVDFDTQG